MSAAAAAAAVSNAVFVDVSGTGVMSLPVSAANGVQLVLQLTSRSWYGPMLPNAFQSWLPREDTESSGAQFLVQEGGFVSGTRKTDEEDRLRFRVVSPWVVVHSVATDVAQDYIDQSKKKLTDFLKDGQRERFVVARAADRAEAVRLAEHFDAECVLLDFEHESLKLQELERVRHVLAVRALIGRTAMWRSPRTGADVLLNRINAAQHDAPDCRLFRAAADVLLQMADDAELARKQADLATSKVSQTSNELSLTRNLLETTVAERERAQHALELLRAQLDASQQQRTQLANTCNELTAAYNELKERLADTAKTAADGRTVAEQAARIAAQAAQVAGLQSTLDDSNATIDSLKKQVASVQLQCAQLVKERDEALTRAAAAADTLQAQVAKPVTTARAVAPSQLFDDIKKRRKAFNPEQAQQQEAPKPKSRASDFMFNIDLVDRNREESRDVVALDDDLEWL